MEIKSVMDKLEIQKVPEHTNYLTSLKTTLALTDDDKIIIEKKYASKNFKQLNDLERLYAVKSLLLKIHVITGWVLPTAELMNILIDQFSKKVVENYSELNPDEIEFAFRNKGTMLKDWGKEINLNLIDEILSAYISERFDISKSEEKLLPPPKLKIWTDEEILNQYREEIETAYQAIKKGYKPIIHKYFAETLISDGLMDSDKESVNDFFESVIEAGSANLYFKQF